MRIREPNASTGLTEGGTMRRRAFLGRSGATALAACPWLTGSGRRARAAEARSRVYPTIPRDRRLVMLKPPTSPVEIVLDTDAFNEIDDKFALAYALLSSDRLTVRAVYAAPFKNSRSRGPADGIEKSYAEIHRVLERMGMSARVGTFRGSRQFLANRNKAVPSAAAEHLVESARELRRDPLYVVAIGCLTNVASAILLEPRIIRNIVVVWDAAYPHTWPRPNQSFNMPTIRGPSAAPTRLSIKITIAAAMERIWGFATPWAIAYVGPVHMFTTSPPSA